MNNLTPEARQILALAREEADRLNHTYVSTEHLLLGLIKLGQGVAFNVLLKLGLDPEKVRLEVENQNGIRRGSKMAGDIPYVPRVQEVLALAGREARDLNQSYVGSEHILLGLLREGEGVAAVVLRYFEIDAERTLNKVLEELNPNLTPREQKESEETSGE